MSYSLGEDPARAAQLFEQAPVSIHSTKVRFSFSVNGGAPDGGMIVTLVPRGTRSHGREVLRPKMRQMSGLVRASPEVTYLPL
jgi:hypothetical protein